MPAKALLRVDLSAVRMEGGSHGMLQDATCDLRLLDRISCKPRLCGDSKLCFTAAPCSSRVCIHFSAETLAHLSFLSFLLFFFLPFVLPSFLFFTKSSFKSDTLAIFSCHKKWCLLSRIISEQRVGSHWGYSAVPCTLIKFSKWGQRLSFVSREQP